MKKTIGIEMFMTHCSPSLGSYYLCAFVTGVIAVTAWQRIAGRRPAVRALSAQVASGAAG